MIGNKFLSVAGASEPTDAQFNYVTMLLHGDGTNGAQNNTFLDSSTNNFTITRNGNTTQGSFSPYGSNWSNYFGGSEYLTGPTTNSAFDFGSGDWTIETWAFPTAFSSQMAVFISLDNATSSAYAVGLLINTNGSVRVYQYGGSYFINSTSTTGVVSLNAWSHIAAVRSGSTFAIFVNGTRVASVTGVSGTQAANKTVNIGQDPYASNLRFSGYLSNLRVVKGTAVYNPSDSTITVPTTALTAISGTSLLTCQSNRFKDSSSNAFTITANGTPSVQRFNPFGASTAYSTTTIGGSGYFDGSSDYLSVANNTAFDMGSGDFTIEGWMYQTSASGSQAVCSKYEPSNQASWFIGTVGASWDVYLYYGSSSNVAVYTGAAPALNQWNHFALERNGSNLEFYVNGSRLAQVGAQTMRTTTSAVAIGRTGSGYTEYFFGNISDLRIRKGTATYSGTTYPVPTAPLTAVANTSLLCNMTNGAIYDNAMMNDLETVGNAQISTSVKKYGTGSLAFDGTGDYLKTRKDVTVGDLGSGDFTLECWARVNTTNAMDFFGTGTWSYYIGSGQSGWAVSQIGSLVAFSYQVNNAWIIADSFAGTTLAINTWYHIAIVRYNGVIKCYLNGTASSTTISNTSNMVSTLTSGLIVGGGSDPNAYNMNGYLDDLRITKGYARYTTNFTPPTAALPDKGT